MRLLTACAVAFAISPASAKPRSEPASAKPRSQPASAKPRHVPHRGWPGPAAGPTMSGDPELVLTFDDGPNPRTTPAVLDTLAKHHIRAVFFLVGERVEQKQAPPIIQRMLREGHIVANHTMTHKDLCRMKDDARAAHEIDAGKAAIESAIGYSPAWFRAPYGVRCPRVDKLLGDRQLAHFHWDIDPQEWKDGNATRAIAYVEREVGRMTGRNVLLMHDVKKATVVALPTILDWIDTENARRARDHKRRIRIVNGDQIAIERLPPGLADWLAGAVLAVSKLASQIAAALP